MMMRRDDPRHGTRNGYGNLGCRCDLCRAANTAYRKNVCGCGRDKHYASVRCRACNDVERTTFEHGMELRYRRGCRCDECRAAATAARRRRRAKAAAWMMRRDDPRHGTYNGYGNLGCRCDLCRAANTAYYKSRGIGSYSKNVCGCGQDKDCRAVRCRACYFAERM